MQSNKTTLRCKSNKGKGVVSRVSEVTKYTQSSFKVSARVLMNHLNQIYLNEFNIDVFSGFNADNKP